MTCKVIHGLVHLGKFIWSFSLTPHYFPPRKMCFSSFHTLSSPYCRARSTCCFLDLEHFFRILLIMIFFSFFSSQHDKMLVPRKHLSLSYLNEVSFCFPCYIILCSSFILCLLPSFCLSVIYTSLTRIYSAGKQELHLSYHCIPNITVFCGGDTAELIEVQWKIYTLGIGTRNWARLGWYIHISNPVPFPSFFIDLTDEQSWGETTSRDKEQYTHPFTALARIANESSYSTWYISVNKNRCYYLVVANIKWLQFLAWLEIMLDWISAP